MECLAYKGITIFFMVTTAVWASANAKVYKVGDSAGWTTIGNVDYNSWASSNTFNVGDTILFKYNPQVHNVMEVSHSDFRTCNAAAPIKTYTSGNDSITIMGPGHYYFLCGIPGHCQEGQKVDIRVLKTHHTNTSPSLAPSASQMELMAPSPSPAMSKASSTHIHNAKWAGLFVLASAIYYCFRPY